MGLRVQRPGTLDDFETAASAFLAEREAEHNLLLGICTAIRTTPEVFADDPPRFATVHDASGRIALASLRTPPFNQVLSEATDLEAVDALVDALATEPLPGVLGPRQAAARFVERWADVSGRAARLAVAERIFRLDRVVPPARPATGGWRLAEPRDRQLIADWLLAFGAEAMPGESPPPDPLAVADRWISGRNRQVYLWEDEGRVVSLVGAGGRTPNGIRIGPVYTPPEDRARGYATSLTAAVSQDQLDRGRRFCFLFTDLANPTSNRIYQEIGYRPVADVDQYRFEADA